MQERSVKKRGHYKIRKDAYPPTAIDYVPAVVLVRWTDAASEGNGWHPISFYTEYADYACMSVGLLIKDDEEGLRILQTIAPYHGSGSECLFIPKKMIRSIKILSRPFKFV